jgi:hypothetical protein
VKGYVFEEADFEPHGDDLTQVGRGREVLATGAEIGEAEMTGTGEFEAGRYDRGVEIEDGTKLNLNAELHGVGRECLATDDPAPAVCEGRGESGKHALALFIAETLDVERLHGMERPPRLEGYADRVYIGTE